MLLFALTLVVAQSVSLNGTWQSPIGPLTVRETNDGVTATVAGKNVCGFARGEVVFSGARLDDSLMGTLTSCRKKSGSCSGGAVVGDAVLLVDDRGHLQGTVHLPLGPGCRGPIEKTLRLSKTAAKKPKKASTQKKREAVALLLEAHALLDRGQFEDARQKCQTASTLDPTRADAHTCIGVSYFRRDRRDEALAEYSKALELAPDDGVVYYNIACAYVLINEKVALEYLQLALLNGFLRPDMIDADNDWKTLKSDARFQALLRGEPLP